MCVCGRWRKHYGSNMYYSSLFPCWPDCQSLWWCGPVPCLLGHCNLPFPSRTLHSPPPPPPFLPSFMISGRCLGSLRVSLVKQLQLCQVASVCLWNPVGARQLSGLTPITSGGKDSAVSRSLLPPPPQTPDSGFPPLLHSPTLHNYVNASMMTCRKGIHLLRELSFPPNHTPQK